MKGKRKKYTEKKKILAYLHSYIRHNTSTMKNNTATTVITKHNRENKPSSRVTMIISITIGFFYHLCRQSSTMRPRHGVSKWSAWKCKHTKDHLS